ncbi:uncharacterized protein LOC111701706 [Eurytemora carolleeae]|uniref:uncharacterized protein LOC111701706 n=1 Tax=Eurytemora carolleeae TaxID=1294199 RepID=UPI000C77529D|nr:uncharacterized protein LOC111701706 [Eurytemora carolleeae]|eukprot:XP_023328876.1 uncharacterized protein LOC111701706 [Eurytemora affinis]
MMSTRISTFFLNRNLRPRRLEQFYSVLQSSIDETNSEVVDTPRAERTYVEMNDNNSILNFVNKMKKADSSILCSNVIKLAKLNPEQEQKVELKQDKRFSFILRHLEQDVRGVDPLALISCLKALKMLEIAEDSFVMKNLENALVWRSRSASIKGKH